MAEPEPEPVAVERLLGTQDIVRVFFTVLGLAVVTYLAYEVRSVLLLVFIAAFLAVALGPAVDRLERLRLPRAGAILLVYVGILAGIVGVGLLVVPPVVDQVDQLSRDAPGYLQDLRENKTFRTYDDKYEISDELNKQAAQLPSRLGDAAGALQSVTVGIFTTLVQLITVLTMTFFLLLEGGRLVAFTIRSAGRRREERLRALAGDIYRSTSGYVAGALTLAVFAGTSAFILLELLGTPFAVPLAVLMAFLDLIPLIGATVAGVVIGIVTAFTDFPGDTIVWAIFFLIYQQLENNVLQPMVYRRAVNVAPLLVIVSILIGSSLLGVLGALVAIPIAAAVQIIIRDLWRHRANGRYLAVDSSSVSSEAGSAPTPSSPGPTCAPMTGPTSET